MEASEAALSGAPEMQGGKGKRVAKGAGLVALGALAIEGGHQLGDVFEKNESAAQQAPADARADNANHDGRAGANAEHGSHAGLPSVEQLTEMKSHELVHLADKWTYSETQKVAETIAGMNDEQLGKMVANIDIDRTHDDFGQHMTGLDASQTMAMLIEGSIASPDNAAANKALLTGHQEVLLSNPASLSTVERASHQHFNDIRAVAGEVAAMHNVRTDASLAGEQTANYGVINGVIDYSTETLYGADAEATAFVTDDGDVVKYKDSCGNVQVAVSAEGAPVTTTTTPGGGAPDQPSGGAPETTPGGGGTPDQPSGGAPETTPGGGGPTIPEGEHDPSDPAGGDGFGENPPILPETPPVEGTPQDPPPGEVTPDPGGGTAPTLPEIPPGDAGDGAVTPPPTTDPEPQAPDAGGGGGHAGDF